MYFRNKGKKEWTKEHKRILIRCALQCFRQLCHGHCISSISLGKTKPKMHCAGIHLPAGNHDCLSKACVQGACLYHSSIDKGCIDGICHACICDVWMYGALHACCLSCVRLNAACVPGRPTCRCGGSNRAAGALHTLSIPLRKSWASCWVGAGLLCICTLQPHTAHQQQGAKDFG